MFLQLCLFLLCLAALVLFGAGLVAYGLGFITGMEYLAAMGGTGYFTWRAASHLE